MRIETVTDQWFTPPCIIEALQEHNGKAVLDVTTCEDAPVIPGVQKWIGDALTTDWVPLCDDVDWLFCNPPYSRASGGAQKFIRHIWESAPRGCVFLVNYDAWVPRIAEELGLGAALFTQRIAFVPGPGNNAGQPRHANALLYDYDLTIPSQLGDYRVRKEHIRSLT